MCFGGRLPAVDAPLNLGANSERAFKFSARLRYSDKKFLCDFEIPAAKHNQSSTTWFKKDEFLALSLHAIRLRTVVTFADKNRNNILTSVPGTCVFGKRRKSLDWGFALN